MVNRRQFFRTAVATIGAVFGAATAASALMLDPEPPAELNTLYHTAKAACGGPQDAYHRQLLAEAEATVAGGPVNEEERQRLLAAVTCPICGCAVSALP